VNLILEYYNFEFLIRWGNVLSNLRDPKNGQHAMIMTFGILLTELDNGNNEENTKVLSKSAVKEN
jgi:hypothetical protein